MTASGKELPGVIDVTSATTYLRVPKGYLPDFLEQLVGPLSYAQPLLFSEGGIVIGTISHGTPINLLSIIDLELRGKVLRYLIDAKRDLKSFLTVASDEVARKDLAN